MIIPIELRFKADKDSKSVFQTGKTIKSHDVKSVEFHITIEGLELTDNHTAKILSIFHSSESQANMDCEIVEGKIIYKPDTNLISMYEHVTNYVYVYHNTQSLDVREFIYTVDLSKIDETSLEVKEVYDQSYADLLADFELALSDYKDSLPQADSIRADIDEILNQFGVDSQAKLSQYDADAQQAIIDLEQRVGPQGEQGPKGDKGDIGPKGDKGDKGDQGEIGPKGETGLQGPKGDKGDTGPQGETGPKGDKGDAGEVGPQGDRGIQGDPGPEGPKGDIGPQGEIGPKGDSILNDATGTRLKYWAGSQSEYDAIGTYDLDAIYDIWG